MMKRQRAKHRAGYSLIELTIALGIIGVVAAGVWSAAHAAREAHRVNQAVDQVRRIVEATRSLYNTANAVQQEDFTDFTQRVAAADVFPAETKLNPRVQATTCAVNAPCYFAHPWSVGDGNAACGGGSYCMGGSLATLQNPLMGSTTTRGVFALLLRALPQSACVELATRHIGIWDDIGLVGIGFRNGDGGTPSTAFFPNPPTVTNIVANCAAGNANSLYFSFRI